MIKTKTSPEPKTQTKYFEGIGRRKTAVARVRIYEDGKNKVVSVNGKDLKQYFPQPKLQAIAESPLLKTELSKTINVSVKIKGGGVNAQAEAIRHGLSRAIIHFNQSLRPALKSLGFLKRDPRMVERKKYGLKKARRAPQWQKR